MSVPDSNERQKILTALVDSEMAAEILELLARPGLLAERLAQIKGEMTRLNNAVTP